MHRVVRDTAMQTGRVRLIGVNLRDWNPEHQVIESLLDKLGESARRKVHSFRFKKDSLRSLVARLLPLWELCCRDHADADASPPSRQYKWTQLTQAKAAKGRPFILDVATQQQIPYDFNDTHDGDWVVMASCHLESSSSSSNIKLGVDVMELSLPVGIPSVRELEETVYDMLSEGEKGRVALTPSSEKLHLLLDLWACKEAISKAMGEGLSFPYGKIDTSSMRPLQTQNRNDLDQGDSSSSSTLLLDIQGKTCSLRRIVHNTPSVSSESAAPAHPSSFDDAAQTTTLIVVCALDDAGSAHDLSGVELEMLSPDDLTRAVLELPPS